MTARFRGLVIAGDASAFASSGESAKARSKDAKSSRTRSGSCRELGARTTSTRALAYREATAAGIFDIYEVLRLAWTDPQALDPSRRSARVTREIAKSLGLLAQSLEKSGHSAETTATFLMRALFTMFAEDVELLPKESFIGLLQSLHGRTDQFVPMIEELWGRMKTGGFSTVLREKIRHFNGSLFAGGFPKRLNLEAKAGELGIHGGGAFLGVGADLPGILDPFADFAGSGREIGAGLFRD